MEFRAVVTALQQRLCKERDGRVGGTHGKSSLGVTVDGSNEEVSVVPSWYKVTPRSMPLNNAFNHAPTPRDRSWVAQQLVSAIAQYPAGMTEALLLAELERAVSRALLLAKGGVNALPCLLSEDARGGARGLRSCAYVVAVHRNVAGCRCSRT